MLAYNGNPHSAEHSVGAEAQAAIDESAMKIASSLGMVSSEVTFTPGASAALWLAVEDAIARAGNRLARIAATAVEHPALLSALRKAQREGTASVTIVPVDGSGAPHLDALEAIVAEGVDLLCTMAANNEVGTVSDLSNIAAIAGRHGARHLIDASQAVGRVDPAAMLLADIVIISGAKAYGPRRTGAMIGPLTSRARQLGHDIFGSPDAPAAIALATAITLRGEERSTDEYRIGAMRDALEARLIDAVPGLKVNGSRHRIAGSLHVSTPHIPGEAAVARLWGQVAVSTGAACQSGVPGPSHVLSAMGVEEWVADGAVRIGVGKFNSPEDIDRAAEMMGAALRAEPVKRIA